MERCFYVVINRSWRKLEKVMNKKLLVVALGSLALVACSAQDIKTTKEANMQNGV